MTKAEKAHRELVDRASVLAKETGQNVSYADGYHVDPQGKRWVTFTSNHRSPKEIPMTPEEVKEMEELFDRRRTS